MIRKLKKEDLSLCVALAHEAGAGDKIESILGERFKLHNDSIFMIEFYVFEENGIIKAVAGLSNSIQDYQTYNLLGCYVKPEFQYQGIGKQLVEFRLNEIKSMEPRGQLVFATTKEPWHLERFGFVQLEKPYKEYIPMQLNIFYDD